MVCGAEQSEEEEAADRVRGILAFEMCRSQRAPGASPRLNSAIPSRKGFPRGETGLIWPPTWDLENNSLATGSRALHPEAMAKPKVIL